MQLPRAILIFLSIALLLAVADASAQDKGKTGITMGYPASVGFVAHVTDRFAIRPELNLSFATTESDSPFSVLSADTSTVGVGLSALFYLGTKDQAAPVRQLTLRLWPFEHLVGGVGVVP